LGAVETPAVIDSLEKPSQAPAQFKITQAVSISGLNAGLEDRQSPFKLWLRTGHNSNDFISALLLPLAAVPGILRSDTREVEALIGAIALAAGSDEDGLLAPRDWIVVTSAAAEEVARNPGRLIKLDTAPAEQPLAVLLLIFT
jgi:hypothetical protein